MCYCVYLRSLYLLIIQISKSCSYLAGLGSRLAVCGCTPTVDTLTAVSSLLNFDIDRCIYIDTLQYSEEVPTGALQPPGLINLSRSCFNRF